MSCRQRERNGKLISTKENWYNKNKHNDRVRELKEQRKRPLPELGAYVPQWGYESDDGFTDVMDTISSPLKNVYLRDIEGIFCLVNGMMGCKTDLAVGCVFALWLRDNIKESLCGTVLTYFKNLIDTLPPVPQNGIELDNSPQWIKALKLASTNWKEFSKNPMFGHISKFLGLVVSIGICNAESLTFNMGNFQVVAPHLYGVHSDAKDVFGALLDSIHFFADAVYKCYIDRSLKPLLTSKSEMDTLDTNFMEIRGMWDYARNGNLYKFRKTEDVEFVHMLNRTLRGYKDMSTSVDRLAKRMLEAKINELNQIQRDFILQKKGSGLRRRPFAIEVVGNSAAGKSTYLNQIIDVLLASQELDLDLSRRYVKTSKDPYLSGWLTSHLTMTMDDFGNEVTDSNGKESDIGRMVIDVVNNQVFVPNMAELEQKGSMFVEPELFCITTNVKDLHARKLSACPISIQGRMNYIINIEPVSKYKKTSEAGVALGIDTDKVKESQRLDPPKTPFDDRVWKITIQRCVQENPDDDVKALGKYVTVRNKDGKPLENINFIEAANFLVDEFNTHRETQREIVESANKCRSEAKLCPIPGCKQLQHMCLKHDTNGVTSHTEVIANDGPVAMSQIHIVGRNPPIARLIRRGRHAPITGGDVPTTSEIAIQEYNEQFEDDSSVTDSQFDTQSGFLDDMKEMFYPTLDSIAAEAFSDWKLLTTTWMRVCLPAFRYVAVKWFRFIADDSMFYFVPGFILRQPIVKRFIFTRRLQTAFNSWTLRIQVLLATLATFWTTSKVFDHSVLWTILILVLFWCVAMRYIYVTTERYIANRMIQTEVRMSSYIGERQSKNLKIFAQAIPFVFIGYQVLKVCRSYQSIKQGDLEPKSAEEVEKRDSEATIWTDVATRELPLSSVNKTTTTSVLEGLVEKNLLYLTILMNGERWMANGFMIKTNVIAIPDHYVKTEVFEIIARKKNPDANGGKFTTTLHKKHSYLIPGSDIRLFYTASGGSFRNMIKHFPLKIIGNVPFKMAWREEKGTLKNWKGRLSSPGTIRTCVSFTGATYKALSDNTFGGLCGATLVSDTGTACILGFHLGGVDKTPKGVCGLFSQDQFETGISHLDRTLGVVLGADENKLPQKCFGKEIDFTTDTPHEKSPVNYMPHGSQICYHGSFPDRSTSKSHVIETPISHLVAMECGVPNTYHRPKMRPEWYGYSTALSNMSLPGKPFRADLLQKAIECYQTPLRRLVSKGGLFNNIKPLTYDENLNGINGKRFIDAMKFKTAIGFPCTGSKSKYLEIDTPGQRVFNDDVNNEIILMEECYKRGERAYPIIKACKKDEILPKADKCRIFWSNPVHLTYMIRKYYLPLCRVMQMNPLEAECAVGVNAISNEWEQLNQFIMTHGKDRIVAGDYSKYDQKMPTQMILAAFDILIGLAEIAGYSKDDLTVMRNMTTDIVYPIVAMNGDVISFTQGSHISGNSLTVIINGIVGALQWRMCFYSLYPHMDFRDNVSLITYGDDNIGTVSANCTEFNIVSIHRFLKEHGQQYTMPDKDSELIPFIPVEDVVFLQRFTVVQPDGTEVGALSERSIFKRLHCILHKSGNGMSVNESCAENIDTSLCDFFFHGKELYEKRRSELQIVAREAEIDHMCRNLDKTYEDWFVWWFLKYGNKSVSDSKLKSLKLPPRNQWGTGVQLNDSIDVWIPDEYEVGLHPERDPGFVDEQDS